MTRERRAREQESACNKRCWSGPLWDDQWATHVLNDGLAMDRVAMQLPKQLNPQIPAVLAGAKRTRGKSTSRMHGRQDDSDVETSPEVNQGIRPSNSTFGGPSLIDARKEVTVDAFSEELKAFTEGTSALMTDTGGARGEFFYF